MGSFRKIQGSYLNIKSHPAWGVQYAESLPIKYLIKIDILQNSLIDILLFSKFFLAISIIMITSVCKSTLVRSLKRTPYGANNIYLIHSYHSMTDISSQDAWWLTPLMLTELGLVRGQGAHFPNKWAGKTQPRSATKDAKPTPTARPGRSKRTGGTRRRERGTAGATSLKR